MENKRVVFSSEKRIYRIVELPDHDTDIDDLKGDIYNPELINEMGYTGTVAELRAEELEFEDLVNREGVYGYRLERWNPEPGQGWETVDSCWGFVGQYSPEFKHYIVDEMIGQVPIGS